MLGEITDKTPFDGYTDKDKTEKAIFRDVFKKGDAWFNTGDMMQVWSNDRFAAALHRVAPRVRAERFSVPY